MSPKDEKGNDVEAHECSLARINVLNVQLGSNDMSCLCPRYAVVSIPDCTQYVAHTRHTINSGSSFRSRLTV